MIFGKAAGGGAVGDRIDNTTLFRGRNGRCSDLWQNKFDRRSSVNSWKLLAHYNRTVSTDFAGLLNSIRFTVWRLNYANSTIDGKQRCGISCLHCADVA